MRPKIFLLAEIKMLTEINYTCLIMVIREFTICFEFNSSKFQFIQYSLCIFLCDCEIFPEYF